MAKNNFCKMVKDSIDDEKKASRFYNRMKKGQPKGVKSLIEGVKKDEIRHNRLFRKLERKMC